MKPTLKLVNNESEKVSLSEQIFRCMETDILLLDDFDFLSCSELSQVVLSRLISYFIDENRQIVLGSKVPLEDFTELNSDLIACVKRGVAAHIHAPDCETKQAMLMIKAQQEGIECSGEVLCSLAKRKIGSLKELEGLLILLSVESKLRSCPITTELCNELF